jgi:hypothetical protein
MADAPAWFVVPVMPGILSQIAGYFKGSSGTYKIVKTFVGHPLYKQYTAAGYGPPYDSYPAAAAAAKQFAATGAANRLQPSSPGQIQGSGVQSGPSIPGLSAFFGALSNANTWIRVGEAVAGLILLGIGLNSMLKGKPLQFVTRAAGVAGKAAML